MAAQTTNGGRGGTRRMNLLRYIVHRFSVEPEPEACLMHGDILSEVGIKDRRTWLKHLHGLEDDRLLSVCYGKNQYAPTRVRPGEMLWHLEDKMLWHGYEHGGQVKHLRDNDAMVCLRVEAGASIRTCHSAPPAKTLACSLKKRKKARSCAMALPKNAMAREDAMAFSEDAQMLWHEECKDARTNPLRSNDAMACLRVKADASTRTCHSTSPVGNSVCAHGNRALRRVNAIAVSKKNAMAPGNVMAFSATCQVPWHFNAMTLSLRPDTEEKSNFCNVLFFSNLKKSDIYRYYINSEYSISSKIINLQVGSVLSSIDSGTVSEKVTHTRFCTVETSRGGRRKEKAGDGQLMAASRVLRAEPDGGTLPATCGEPVIEVRSGGNVWLQWVSETAHRLMIDRDAFGAFSDRWIARARLNGKLAKYQTHSIKDFIIQDFMKEQTDKCNEAVMTAAIQSATAPIAPQATASIPMQTQGLRIPRGVTLSNRWWGSTKDKQMELRGVAADYEYCIGKILLGRRQEVGLHKLMELHDIFRLNIPAYAAQYPGIGHDDERGYQAAEQWIHAAARAGYSPKYILQQAGFC